MYTSMDSNLNEKLKDILIVYWVFKYVSTDYTPIIFKPPPPPEELERRAHNALNFYYYKQALLK